MSVPHTGQLTARIAGLEYKFNGNLWVGPVATTVAALNTATAAAPKHHFDVRSLAEVILQRANIRAEIITWRPDVWPGELGPGDGD